MTKMFSGGLRAGIATGVAACLVAASGGAAGAVSEATSIDPVEGYVERAYLDLLGRGVDAVGAATWSTAIRGGVPRVRVANGITASAEFRTGLITGAYQHYLGRPADAPGLASWLAAMGRGATIQQLEAGFLASPEYVAAAGSGWVNSMYTDVLGRGAGAQEVQFWNGVLAGGAVTRQGVALGILLSDEHLTAVINGDYQDLLGRDIDATGRRGWVSAIQAGVRYEQVLGGIVASNEYWVLGIPDGAVPLRGEGRIGAFPTNAPADEVIAFLNDLFGAEPVELDHEGTCGPDATLWDWDGVVLVVRTTDEAGQTVSPYAAGWMLVGPPTATTALVHTAEGLRVGDPASRIREVYPAAVEVHPDPTVHLWEDHPTDPAYLIQSFDEGQGLLVELVVSGDACDE